MVTFDAAPQIFADAIVDRLGLKSAQEGRLVRDIYGRLRFISTPQNKEQVEVLVAYAAEQLGPYAAPIRDLIVEMETNELSALLEEPSVAIDDRLIRMIDRRLAGGDWLTYPSPLVESPQRLVFYSIKGGVGRSTGLAITAADLADHGLNILVIDLDLEAPGLGSVLLSRETMPSFGVVDWFAALAAGADVDEMVPDMTGPSPFTSVRSVVDVVPAKGTVPGAYLSKLARAYTPGSAAEHYAGFTFADKVNLLITKLCTYSKYDVVLIDARAGLHETSGSIILGLGAKILLFGTETEQTFDDFALLLPALRDAFDPELNGADLRSSFKMVHGKAPRDEKDLQQFRERSWEVWSNYLYDDIDPSQEKTSIAFTFDIGNEEAPHYPLEIVGDDSYSRFDPRTQTYALHASAYAPVFGRFLKGVRKLLGLP